MRKMLSLKFPRFNLRIKFLVIVLFLSALPWFGYRYFNELDVYLKQTQFHNLSNTSQAVATALQQRPKLFERLNFSRDKIQPKDFYLYQLKHPVNFTGNTTDWQHSQIQEKVFRGENKADKAIVHLGQFEGQIYMSFDISAPNLALNFNSPSPYSSQYLQISTIKNQHFSRYLLTFLAGGELKGFSLPNEPAMITPLTPEPDIEGNWIQTPNGMLLQVSFSKGLLGESMAFESYFHTIYASRSISSSSVNSPFTLGRLIEPSNDIEQIIDSLDNTDSRIWVLNHAGQVLAKGGEIHESGQNWSSGINKPSYVPDFLKPIYSWFIGSPNQNFIDPNRQQIQFDDPMTQRALKGFKGQAEIGIANSDMELLSSATPIWHQGIVVGAVLAQQTTQGIQDLRSHAMTSLLNTALIVTLLASTSMLIFATSISRRITRLRDQAESVIDSEGKIQAIDIDSRQADEIGDLTRSFSSMLNRVEGYNHYLENMSSRLSHELRTPITIVRSSLEHLEYKFANDEFETKYLSRAQQGLQRLNGILNSMTEATHLEATLSNEQKESINLSELIKQLGEMYQQIYSQHQIKVSVEDKELYISGIADHLAQMLDKIIANASEFAKPETEIAIVLKQKSGTAILSISNYGIPLPEGMETDIFNSMVSIRTSDPQKTHLGLGLYISAMICRFHNANITAFNDRDQHKVTFEIKFPLI
ncbi:ATP-binding protein [Parashewanella tropica]|uniref:ATP-binding protein n=1 Tax=Parashewanella tropica TaxID=2547970 RepID=UPI0010592501|nr:ATP-binding protein [Parashewanella tropica]